MVVTLISISVRLEIATFETPNYPDPGILSPIVCFILLFIAYTTFVFNQRLHDLWQMKKGSRQGLRGFDGHPNTLG